MHELPFENVDPAAWDEHDWERFFQRAETRVAKYQELSETLRNHPRRGEIIAQEMGWDQATNDCDCAETNCRRCDHRHECELYEMLRLTSEPANIEDDPDAQELIACFEQVKRIPAYCRAEALAMKLEEALQASAWDGSVDEDVRSTLLSAQMTSAQIAGGHGMGYDQDSLCGNIANCKRALRSLSDCLAGISSLEQRAILAAGIAAQLRAEGEQVSTELNRWIESLRALIWWR